MAKKFKCTHGCNREFDDYLELFNGQWACPFCANILNAKRFEINPENDAIYRQAKLYFFRYLTERKTINGEEENTFDERYKEKAIEYCLKAARDFHPGAKVLLGYFWECGWMGNSAKDTLENRKKAKHYYEDVQDNSISWDIKEGDADRKQQIIREATARAELVKLHKEKIGKDLGELLVSVIMHCGTKEKNPPMYGAFKLTKKEMETILNTPVPNKKGTPAPNKKSTLLCSSLLKKKKNVQLKYRCADDMAEWEFYKADNETLSLPVNENESKQYYLVVYQTSKNNDIDLFEAVVDALFESSNYQIFYAQDVYWAKKKAKREVGNNWAEILQGSLD